MKNKVVRNYIASWAILVGIFNLCCFATPSSLMGFDKFGGAFWGGYIFIMLSFIGQLVCAIIAFNAKTKERFFLNIPLIRISYSGLITSIIVGAICMALPNVPNWVAVVACGSILSVVAISVMKAQAAAEIIDAVDTKIKVQTFFIKSLTADADSLMARAASAEIKAECKKVYEAIRYSDPMSNDALAAIEGQISIKFNDFSAAVCNSDLDKVTALAKELTILIGDRNNKCKLLK